MNNIPSINLLPLQAVNTGPTYKVNDFNSNINLKDVEIDYENQNYQTNEEIADNANLEKLKKTGAMVVVGGVVALGGAFKSLEKLSDGLTFFAGKAVEGVSFAVGKVVSLFSEEKARKIMDWREGNKEWVANIIAEDLTADIYEMIFEYTDTGKRLNELSYMKYDSDTAKKIQNISTKVTDFALATLLSAATAGVSNVIMPAVGGALSGMGDAASKTYSDIIAQNGVASLDSNTFSVLINGGLTSVAWLGNGRLGKGIYSVGKDMSKLGIKETITPIMKEAFSKESLKKGVTGINGLMNAGTSAMMMGDDISEVINGEKPLNAQTLATLGGKFVCNMTMNVVTDSFRDVISKYKVPSKFTGDELAKKQSQNKDILKTESKLRKVERKIEKTQDSEKLEKLLIEEKELSSNLILQRAKYFCTDFSEEDLARTQKYISEFTSEDLKELANADALEITNINRILGMTSDTTGLKVDDVGNHIIEVGIDGKVIPSEEGFYKSLPAGGIYGEMEQKFGTFSNESSAIRNRLTRELYIEMNDDIATKMQQNFGLKAEDLSNSSLSASDLEKIVRESTGGKSGLADVSEYVSTARNNEKIMARIFNSTTENDWLEERNMARYGDPIGPNFDQIILSVKNKALKNGITLTDEEVAKKIIVGAFSPDKVTNTLVGIMR